MRFTLRHAPEISFQTRPGRKPPPRATPVGSGAIGRPDAAIRFHQDRRHGR